VDRADAIPNAADLSRIPRKLTVAGKELKAVVVKPVNRIVDLGHLYGKPVEGRTAYVFMTITAPQTGQYSIGIGADWWFTAWIDGKEMGSTMGKGNGSWPPREDNNAINASLDEGEHVLVIRVVSGTGGMMLAAGMHSYRGLAVEEVDRMRHIGIAARVLRPLKVVFLGAGSGFLQTLITDVIGIPGADEGELALVDIDTVRLDLADKICRKIIAESGKNWKVVATTDRRKVLKRADYVINCIEVSGVDCVKYDNDIPLKYGIDQCIGDTIGPGGMFKAMRTVPVFLEMLWDVEKYCPNAWVINYTNPMSMMCLAAARASKAKVIGLCHSVQGGSHLLATWAGVPYHEMKWNCAGVNHLAWFTELTHNGRDLYPIIKNRVRTEPDFAQEDRVRIDLMMHFGYYPTESSGHNSEYLPYYRKDKSIMKRYCGAGYSGGTSFYAKNWPDWRKNCDENRRKLVASKDPLGMHRSWEYASYIIQAMETNDSFVIYGNVMNNGLITNLPQDGIVEVACLVDRMGIRPTHFGKLPSQCAALSDWNMRMFDLAADACINKSIETAAHALMLDPLTAAVSCPADIRKMTFEMFEAEKKFLPGFKA
jgi:alpha-galactosidase